MEGAQNAYYSKIKSQGPIRASGVVLQDQWSGVLSSASFSPTFNRRPGPRCASDCRGGRGVRAFSWCQGK